MLRGERTVRLIGLIVVLCAILAISSWGVSRSAAQQDEVGRYQVAVPNLVLDTATGRLSTSTGQVLEQPIDPTGDEVGRYSVDGFMTAVTRNAGLDVINQPVVWPQLVKGYVILDTQTGQILRESIYYRRALQKDDL